MAERLPRRQRIGVLVMVIMLVGLFIGMGIPLVLGGMRLARIETCAAHLRSMYEALGSSMNEPTQAAQGPEWWRASLPQQPDILVCPAAGHDPPTVDYAGWRVGVDTAALTPRQMLSRDRPGNHGGGEDEILNLLFMSGDVESLPASAARTHPDYGWDRLVD